MFYLTKKILKNPTLSYICYDTLSSTYVHFVQGLSLTKSFSLSALCMSLLQPTTKYEVCYCLVSVTSLLCRNNTV